MPQISWNRFQNHLRSPLKARNPSQYSQIQSQAHRNRPQIPID